jgi:hypothetical protein
MPPSSDSPADELAQRLQADLDHARAALADICAVDPMTDPTALSRTTDRFLGRVEAVRVTAERCQAIVAPGNPQ